MSDSEQSKQPGVDLKEKTVTFDYIKSPHFKTIIVEGIFGGISPKGRINMNLWNERWPIPKQTVHEFDEKSGKLKDEKLPARVTRDAIIREVDIALSFDYDTAKKMRDWIDEKITTMEKAAKEIQSKGGGHGI
jgi:hypothetical protein